MARQKIARRWGWLLVLALAAVMAAPAFACQGDGPVLYVTPQPGGKDIHIRGERFQAPEDGGSVVTLKWGGRSGPAIATRMPNSVGVIEAVVTMPGNHFPSEQVSAHQTKQVDGVATESHTDRTFDVAAMQTATPTAPTTPTTSPLTTKPGPLPPDTTPATSPAPVGSGGLAEDPARAAAGSERAVPIGSDPLGPGNVPVLVGPGADDPSTVPAGSVVPPPTLPDARALWSALDPEPGSGLLETGPSPLDRSDRGAPLLLLGGSALLFAAAAVAALRRRPAARVLARS